MHKAPPGSTSGRGFVYMYDLSVGGDAHIAPANKTDFTEICGKFVSSQWGDVGIAPYEPV